MTAIKSTMTPEEIERWAANPRSVIYRGDLANPGLRVRKEPTPLIGECGHPVSKNAGRCRDCYFAAVRTGRMRFPSTRGIHPPRKRLAPTKEPTNSITLEALIDLAWEEKPQMTRDEVATRVRRALRKGRSQHEWFE